ncbi:helicase SNF2 [Parafrankia colletiae]|uniref:Helicase SNF2 n=1 Tax=Parafrankia colletiae TaxID=573497 RepID=A0A1S1QDN6_9ACTN|nr:DEAD/DEAH box helicase [Parafrankia colletiae]MCK9902156.1 DEAD/DEAH box helicase [Frankia sp. Cpl3]OHV29041.1 helicase SNF2 [Parafrankia colletiae]OHV31699.1 helicase SNF2 [Parafrankia colletiae]
MGIDPADRRAVRGLLQQAETLGAAAQAVEAGRARIRGEVEQRFVALRGQMVRRDLATMPLARLREVTGERVRLGPLETAGFRTVLDVLNTLDTGPAPAPRIAGLGERSITQIVAAARQLSAAAEDSIRFHIELDPANAYSTDLLVALHRLDRVERALAQARAGDTTSVLAEELPARIGEAAPARGRVRHLFASLSARERAVAAVSRIDELLGHATATGLVTSTGPDQIVGPLRSAGDLVDAPVEPGAVWEDFERRAPEYYGLLSQIVDLGLDVAAAEGGLPAEIAERVRAQQLDESYRRVALRGYQAFGARFALVQRRVIIGDEMGLGKTIQAIAALAHLRTLGATHFLVVAPAAVLVNWMREVEARSLLAARRLHGPERAGELRRWTRDGGVAVTTFDVARSLAVPSDVEIGMLVVDEAHYIKNPQALRSQAVRGLADRAGRVLFLTGTPMENRVEEFRALVGYLQPELTTDPGTGPLRMASEAFRRAVAPAYLRRNIDDVLSELPELIEVEEAEDFGPAEERAYRHAVLAGNFMAMRRAAYPAPAAPGSSAAPGGGVGGQVGKLRRLLDIVAEAASNRRKVVVFSYFLDVLTVVEQALRAELGGVVTVVGPLDGGTPATARQRIVDEFSSVAGPAVLVSQIAAGGTGLNMQAASVVILCEPQVKPTLEQQAIARCHRMGQVRGVQVHRLVSTVGVDRRLREILAEKRRMFDAFARRSAVAEGTPDAVDVSEQELARQIVEAEQLRIATEAATT